jgi:hypothetical protein
MKLLTTIVTFLSVCTFVFAQPELRDGYIIKLSGDTLFGKVQFHDDVKNSTICNFYQGSNNPESFKPGEISSYRYINGKFYITKVVKTKALISKIFVEYLVKGRKDLYYFRDAVGDHFLINRSNDTVVEVPYSLNIVNKDGTNYFKESTVHKGYLKTYFNECPDLFPRIDAIAKPETDNLISLTKQYHKLTCGDSGCIVYGKPKAQFKMFFEPYVGFTNWKGSAENYSHYGAYVYFWLPRSSERLYFKTGVIVSKIYDDKTYSLVKIPLQLEYIRSDKLVRPKVDLGVNFYSVHEMGGTVTLAANTGFLFQVNKYAAIDINVGSDIWAFTFGTPWFLNYSVGTGLCIQF